MILYDYGEESIGFDAFERHLRDLHAGGWAANSIPGRNANAEFDRFIAKVRADAIRDAADKAEAWEIKIHGSAQWDSDVLFSLREIADKIERGEA